MKKLPDTSSINKRPPGLLERLGSATVRPFKGGGNPIESDLVSQKDFDVLDRIRQDAKNHPAWRRFAIGVLLVTGVLQSGGVIDRAFAPFFDPKATVYEAGLGLQPKTQEIREIMKQGGDAYDVKIDGLPLGRHSEYVKQRYIDGDPKINAATEVVADLMDKVDIGDYASVIAASKQFEASHTFVGNERLNETLEALDKAKNNDEMFRIMQDHMAFYEISFLRTTEDSDGYYKQFSDATSANDTRRMAKSIVQAFAFLPKELTDFVKLAEISLANSDGSIAGVHNRNDSSITMSTNTLLTEAFIQINDIINGGGDKDSYGNVLHEFGHALDVVLQGSLNTDAPVSNASSYRDLSDFEILKITFRPFLNFIFGSAAPSGYALTNQDEHFAETWRGISSSTNDGMVRPGEIRHYNGEGMKGQLQLIILLEKQFPGIAAYLIANNSNMIPYAHIISPYVNPYNAELINPNKPPVNQPSYRPADTSGPSLTIGDN